MKCQRTQSKVEQLGPETRCFDQDVCTSSSCGFEADMASCFIRAIDSEES